MFTRCLPNVFCTKSVEHLDKRHCNLNHVPDEVLRHQRTLEELFLDSNQLRDLPKALFRSTQLRRLTISDNEINRISPDIGNLHLLQEFDCSRNEILDLPEEIQFCQNLQVLDTSGNPLQNGLPNAITSLMNLSHLTLNDVSLTQLPDNIGNLENLRCLEARENLLTVIPESLCEIQKLVTLDLGNNELIKLPNTIGQLSNLRELWLDVNEITCIPEEIIHLKRLQCLDLSSNKITILPDQIGELTSLSSLELSQNRLKYLPETIGRIKTLTVLKADQNALQQLPDSIGWCSSLTELIVTSNSLKDLPANIGHLSMLKHLNADKNMIKHLPSTICKCSQLGILSLRYNVIEYMPDDIGSLKELRVLDLTSNRLKYLPYSLASICSDSMSNQLSLSHVDLMHHPSPHHQQQQTFSSKPANLKAIWLSENQARPMLRLQEEIIEADCDYDDSDHSLRTRKLKRILTCYLLPQSHFLTPSMENLSDEAEMMLEATEKSNTKQKSTSQNTMQIKTLVRSSCSTEPASGERTGSVKFSIDVQNEEAHTDGNNNDNLTSRCATILRRQNTPHPKEFKAWKRREKNGRGFGGGATGADMVDSIRAETPMHIPPFDIKCLPNYQSDEDEQNSSAHPSPLIGGASRRCTDRPITYYKNERIEDIIINKPDRFAALGLSIVGGSDQSPSFPLKKTPSANYHPERCEKSSGIYIFKVQCEGLAEKCGVKPGDKVLSVNGTSFENVTHQEAVKILMNVSQKTLILKIKRSECFSELKNITIYRTNESEPLGMKLNGGLGSKGINLDDPTDNGIFITEVVKDGAADRTGLVQVGQRLIAINNKTLFGCRLEDALEMLSGRHGCLTGGASSVLLTVCRGYEPTKTTKQIAFSNGLQSPITVHDKRAYFESQIQREMLSSDFRSFT